MPDRRLDPEHPHFRQLADWQARARREADRHSTHATKRAVDKVEMTEPERMAAHALWQLHRGEILQICRAAYQKSQRAPDAPPLAECDVVQSAWELFLRCLVRYDPQKGSLKTYLYHALRSRVTEYLRTHSAAAPPETLPAQPSRSGAREIDLHAITARLVTEGRLAGSEREQDELEQAWARLTAPLDD